LFATKYYSKLSKTLIFIVLILFFLESVPKIDVKIKPVLNNSYRFLIRNNLKNKTLLEYPLLNLEKGVGVDDETIRLLASFYHKMRLFNGYTGLFIQDYGITRIYLENFFPDNNTVSMLDVLDIDYLKVDKKFVTLDELNRIKSFYKKTIYEDGQSVIFKLPNNIESIKSNKIVSGFTGDHAYGKDRKLYINLYFENTNNKYFANLKQEKVILNLTFYKNNNIVRKKQIYNLLPLIILPKENKRVTFDIYEKPGFNKLKIDIIDFESKKIVSSLTSSL